MRDETHDKSRSVTFSGDAVARQLDYGGGALADDDKVWIGYHDIDYEGAPVCDTQTGGCESDFAPWAPAHGNGADRDCVYLDVALGVLSAVDLCAEENEGEGETTLG